jgi:hypothetical protein
MICQGNFQMEIDLRLAYLLEGQMSPADYEILYYDVI